ncbi:uncharacterized protein A4U43_C08F17050 [Asparagus officinalis]|nr:uncharacterized protein A4U43_C08F17050 [Asparagus officinalis]
MTPKKIASKGRRITSSSNAATDVTVAIATSVTLPHHSASEKDQEDDNESSDSDDEESAEADEDDSDLDLAWKMLDVARIIVEKSLEDTIEKVNIYAALGEVSLEREDFETSLTDYLKALSILERLVEPGTRRMVELYPYQMYLMNSCKNSFLPGRGMFGVGGFGKGSRGYSLLVGDNQASNKVDADGAIGEDEKQVLSGILSELERKVTTAGGPSADLARSSIHIFRNHEKDVIYIAFFRCKFSNKESIATSLNSSQMAVTTGGFDSPTVSTAATNGCGPVTHLGVVGRGVKRASLNNVSTKPLSKKSSLDSSSGVVESTVKDAEIRKE